MIHQLSARNNNNKQGRSNTARLRAVGPSVAAAAPTRLRPLAPSVAAAAQTALARSPELTQWLSETKLIDSEKFANQLEKFVDTPDDVCDLDTEQVELLREKLKPARKIRFDSALAVLDAKRSDKAPAPSLGPVAPLQATMRLLAAATLSADLKQWATRYRLDKSPAFLARLRSAIREPQDLLDLTGERLDSYHSPHHRRSRLVP